MKSFRVMFSVLALAASVLLATAAQSLAGKPSGGGGVTYKVVAWNDLGMHCACPTFGGFLLLPPFNTI